MLFHGKGIVWDAENNKTLCEFINGKFETGDLRTAKILIALGYEHEGEIKSKMSKSESEDMEVVKEVENNGAIRQSNRNTGKSTRGQ